MIDEPTQEMACLYALGALTPEEAAAFAARLRTEPELAALVHDYEISAEALAGTVPQIDPPASLRAKILDAAPAARALEAIEEAAESRPRSGWLPWALAAGLAVYAGFLWLQNQNLAQERAALSRGLAEAAEIKAQLDAVTASEVEKAALARTLQAQVEELKTRNALAEMQVATLSSKLDASYLASIAWDKDAQRGILHVRRLPATDDASDYQLWIIDPDQPVPVSAGVFKVASDGSATIEFAPTQRVSNATVFAVSREKAGGAPQREGPVMLLSD